MRIRPAVRILCLLLLTMSAMASCAISEYVSPVKRSTLLVYMAGNNTLGENNAKSNVYSMKYSIRNGMDEVNLLVYLDVKGQNPMLLHIHDDRIDTVRTYPAQSSIDSRVLKNVIDEVLADWQAQSYGLVMWSHGTGWLPTDKLSFVAPNLRYSQSRSFGQEADTTGIRKYACMELEDMADAIPDNVFDYILFDACYMGNIEVAYALRNKARYIISSCYEIWDTGFPYYSVTKDLINGNLFKVCSGFYDYYDQMDESGRMAGISLVSTDRLEQLASDFRKLAADRQEAISNMDISDIQCFDRFDRHVFFDLENVAEKIAANDADLQAFKTDLERCVPYKISTPYAFYGIDDSIRVERYCGLSVYIPLDVYEESGLNGDYRRTAWSMATDY